MLQCVIYCTAAGIGGSFPLGRYLPDFSALTLGFAREGRQSSGHAKMELEHETDISLGGSSRNRAVLFRGSVYALRSFSRCLALVRHRPSGDWRHGAGPRKADEGRFGGGKYLSRTIGSPEPWSECLSADDADGRRCRFCP